MNMTLVAKDSSGKPITPANWMYAQGRDAMIAIEQTLKSVLNCMIICVKTRCPKCLTRLSHRCILRI